MPNRLTPGAIAKRLFGLDPDRDERASQLCQEALLTLSRNNYRAPDSEDELRSPKRRQFAIRTLALGANFLEGQLDGRIDAELSPQRYGEMLVDGDDLRGSANLLLAREALQGLIDPETHVGQPGGWLLFPFHEDLLWYDARKPRNDRWGVRRVWMRGSGLTLARLLLDPPGDQGVREVGKQAVAAIQATLQAQSPLGEVAQKLQEPLADDEPDFQLEDAERQAWEIGGEERLAELAATVCNHARGVMTQGTASGPARLWQLRTILGLDVAMHALRSAWKTIEMPEEDRFLLLSFGGAPRAENRVRQRSEDTYDRARIALSQAIRVTLSQAMGELANEPDVDWRDEFVTRRDQLSDQVDRLREGNGNHERLAREIVENANYGRPAEGFRRLIQAVGMVAGTRYRYLTATPDLLGALVGALSSEMPMTSDEFFQAVFENWGFVIGQQSATRTSLSEVMDGADLERNARRAEASLADTGLAIALSDRTTMVGERAASL